MAYENGDWIMHGLSDDDPDRIKTVHELVDYVNNTGFLPLFKNDIEGFSVEEHVSSDSWWTGDISSDPWEWRAVIARNSELAYGKFFGKKAGFISLQWLPFFVNFRRDGYDFDSLFEEGIAKRREKLIMDIFENHDEIMSTELKKLAGFGKGKEKNFSGVTTDLQMQTYLTIKDFRRRTNKQGLEYGMSVAVYTTPEKLWGYNTVTKAYAEEPETSRERIIAKVKELYPASTESQIKKLCL